MSPFSPVLEVAPYRLRRFMALCAGPVQAPFTLGNRSCLASRASSPRVASPKNVTAALIDEGLYVKLVAPERKVGLYGDVT